MGNHATYRETHTQIFIKAFIALVKYSNSVMENNFSKDIPCEQCPLQFGHRIVLNMHMSLVHEIEAKQTNNEKEVKLQNENVVKETDFKNEKTILNHSNKSSTIGKIYNTLMPAFSTLNKNDSKTLILSVHEKQKSNKCKICNFSFSQKVL